MLSCVTMSQLGFVYTLPVIVFQTDISFILMAGAKMSNIDEYEVFFEQ